MLRCEMRHHYFTEQNNSNMEKIYIGIDPGSKGFITVIKPNGNIEHLSIADKTPKEILDFLNTLTVEARNYNWGVFACMEEVHAIFGSSAKATFSFGEIFGLLKGIIIASELPYNLVQPKTWQKDIWSNADVVHEYKKVAKNGEVVTRKVINTKATSIIAARRIFPNTDLRKTPRSKNADDNKVDSLLIAEFARRHNL